MDLLLLLLGSLVVVACLGGLCWWQYRADNERISSKIRWDIHREITRVHNEAMREKASALLPYIYQTPVPATLRETDE